MNILEFFSQNPKAWWALAFLVALMVARRPTIEYVRGMMKKKAAQQEVDVYQLLRKEISDVNAMLVRSEQRNRELQTEIEALRREIQRMIQERENQ